MTFSSQAMAGVKAWLDIDDEGGYMMVDGTKVRPKFMVGFFQAEYFKSNAEAYDLMQKAEHEIYVGSVVYLSGAAVATGLLIGGVNQGSGAMVLGGLLTSLTSLIVGGSYETSAVTKYLRAFNIYNGVYSKTNKRSSLYKKAYKFSFVSSSNSLGLGFSF